MIKSPCLNCEDRQVGCHSSCCNYINFRKKIDFVKTKKNEMFEQDLYFIDKKFKR